MTKEQVVKLLVLIESAYPKFITKDETVQQWFQFCGDMDYGKVLEKLKKHIRNSPFPPVIADVAVFNFEENGFPDMVQTWIKKGRERIESNHSHANLKPMPDWLCEYTGRKPI